LRLASLFAPWSVLHRPRPAALRACLLILLLSGSAPPDARAQTAVIGSDRILRVNGIRVFPIGLVELGIDRYPTDWNQRIRDSGANVVWDNGLAYADSTPVCEAIRDSSNAAGYYLVVGSPDTWAWDNLSTPQLEVAQPMYTSDSLAAVNSCFPFWSNHIGYSNRDEAEWAISRGIVGDIDSTHVLTTYTQIHAAEPSKLVTMNFANSHLSSDLEQWKEENAGYVPATDVVMSANYPYPFGPGTCGEFNIFGPTCPMDRLWWVADIWRTELAPTKPLWMVLQAHKGIPLKEARWCATQAVVHGATGLFWAGWTWFHPLGDGESNWPVIRQVIAEFAGLEQILVQPVVPSVVSLEPGVDVMAKVDPADELLILAATRNGFTGEATISMPGVRGHWVEVRSEHRYLPIEDDDTVTDHFAGYDAHIYQVKSIGFQPPVDAPVVAGAAARELRLEVFPNPSTGPVTARLFVPGGIAASVTVHDVSGRRVGDATIRPSGTDAATVTWDARDGAGGRAAPGQYFLRAQAADGSAATARVTLR
jgi:hypothetical protein